MPWENSTLLAGDATGAVARLRERPGKDLVVLGSGELVRALLARGLVDRLVLPIHPLVLGTGRRLFDDGGAFAALTLVDSVTTTTGVMIATYDTGAVGGARSCRALRADADADGIGEERGSARAPWASSPG